MPNSHLTLPQLMKQLEAPRIGEYFADFRLHFQDSLFCRRQHSLRRIFENQNVPIFLRCLVSILGCRVWPIASLVHAGSMDVYRGQGRRRWRRAYAYRKNGFLVLAATLPKLVLGQVLVQSFLRMEINRCSIRLG